LKRSDCGKIEQIGEFLFLDPYKTEIMPEVAVVLKV
jgi:hypothetical protein